ncbi:MAG: membrane protein insertase YidC [Gemmatimonadota bacterium]|nr:membrane protein insertase YidC [Gemmatimonadota bacterium]
MDKRIALALGLTVIVVVLTPILFPTPPRLPIAPRALDSAQAATPSTGVPAGATASVTPIVPVTSPVASPAGTTSPALTATAPTAVLAETITVTTPKAIYRFSTLGAMAIGVRLRQYRTLSPGHSKDANVELTRPGVPLMAVTLKDDKPLDQVVFSVDSVIVGGKMSVLSFRNTLSSGANVVVAYNFPADTDSYMVNVVGEVHARSSPQTLLITLPAGLRSEEADTLDDQRHLAYVVKPAKDDPQSIDFGKVETGQILSRPGPFTWVASKNKYFLVALLPMDTTSTPFASIAVRGGTRGQNKVASAADATLAYPVPDNGKFAFSLYTGPLEWERLQKIGHGIVNANPYGGWLRLIVQPVSGLVMRTLLWLHRVLKLNYGWVLVAFAVAIRVLLWPLNQRAMRSNLKMQRIQPELQEIQKRYKTQPEKQQAEMMKLYKEHNMSPFSMFGGCLPLLLPWPVFIALFFVFQNTIEFRGVSFIWMHDISLKDPFYVLPVLLAVSVFLLSWIGMRGAPDNPQAKMMAYISPLMMFVFFFNIAGGLNLYYLVQNMVSLPQQWLIARERAKVTPRVTTPPKT